MQKQTTPNHLEWQSAPSENLVSNFPERSRQEISQHSIQANEFVSIVEKIFRERISRHIYPDFRYSCHYCGTLDVFIKVSKSTGTIEIDCLECKKIWIDNVNGVNTSCLC
jgi:hypothetical protein